MAAQRSDQSGEIPRIIHQIWLGDSVPDQVAAWIESWVSCHPSWRHMLWRDDDLRDLENQALFDVARTPAVKADIARVEIVKRHGGIYVDADVECHRDVSRLLASAKLVILSEGPTLTNSLFAAVPNHPLLTRLVSLIGSVDRAAVNRPDFDPLAETGPKLWTALVSDDGWAFDPSTLVLPSDFFIIPKSRNAEVLEWARARRYGSHHALATWRRERRLVEMVRRTRLRSRVRRFLDLSAE